MHTETGPTPAQKCLHWPALILILGNPYPGRLLRVPGSRGTDEAHPPPPASLGGCRQIRSTSHWPSSSPLDQNVRPLSASPPAASPSWARDQDVQGQEEQKMSCCANTAQGLGKTQSPVQHRRSAWFPQAHRPAGVCVRHHLSPPAGEGRPALVWRECTVKLSKTFSRSCLKSQASPGRDDEASPSPQD